MGFIKDNGNPVKDLNPRAQTKFSARDHYGCCMEIGRQLRVEVEDELGVISMSWTRAVGVWESGDVKGRWQIPFHCVVVVPIPCYHRC